MARIPDSQNSALSKETALGTTCKWASLLFITDLGRFCIAKGSLFTLPDGRGLSSVKAWACWLGRSDRQRDDDQASSIWQTELSDGSARQTIPPASVGHSNHSLQRAMCDQRHKHPPYNIVSLFQTGPGQGCGIRSAIETGHWTMQDLPGLWIGVREGLGNSWLVALYHCCASWSTFPGKLLMEIYMTDKVHPSCFALSAASKRT
jgi:hypothetical protein